MIIDEYEDEDKNDDEEDEHDDLENVDNLDNLDVERTHRSPCCAFQCRTSS